MGMNLFAQVADAASTAASSGAGNCFDVIVFFAFLAAVIFVAFGMSRGSSDDAEGYFLAGRGLKWWLIGFSLIAANISAEQFVGMSGQGADYIGLAVASYEWIAALSLIIVAFFFLPKFLKAGIYTIPQYLETRYNKAARAIMSIIMMVMLVAVNITVVTYAGAKAYAVFFDGMSVGGMALNLQFFCWVIGIFAAFYIFAGGLKACAWADLLQGSALIVAGGVVLYFAMQKLGSADPAALASSVADQARGINADEIATKLSGAGAWERFTILDSSKLRMNLPSWDLILPVTALFFAIWIPNLYYWGLNQYIIQRTLGAKSLGEGQKGLVFAAFMKLLIPFIVIFPGMIAFNLFYGDMNASAAKASAPEIERFEKLCANPTTSEPLFQFNRSFAVRYPEKAQQILDYNAKAIGVELVKLEREGMEAADVLEQKLIALKKDPKAASCKFSTTTVSGYDTDSAFPLLMSKVVPAGGFKGFMLAALLGAIISSVAAMLNAASTIFTMDIYNEYCVGKGVAEDKRQKSLVRIGRVTVVIFVLIGCIVAPLWADPKYGGVFKAIQEFQGYISPGIFAAFLVGFWAKKVPNCYGVIALIGCPILYGALAKYAPSLDFLNRMAVTFGVLIVLAFILRLIMPRKEAFVQPMPQFPSNAEIETQLGRELANSNLTVDQKEAIKARYAKKMTSEKWTTFLKPSKKAVLFGIIVVIVTIALYFWYWDYSLKMF